MSWFVLILIVLVSLASPVKASPSPPMNISEAEWHFILGSTAYREGRCTEALAEFDQAPLGHFLLMDHLLFYRASCSTTLGTFSDAWKWFQILKRDYPDSVWMGRAARVAAEALVGLKRYNEARQYAEKYRRDNPSPLDKRNADLLRLKIEIAAGARDAAVGLAKRLALQSSNQFEFEEVQQLFPSGLQSWFDAPEQIYAVARSFERHADWVHAAERYESLLARHHLASSMIAQATWRLGMCLSRLHHYQKAIDLLERARLLPESVSFRTELVSGLSRTYAKLNRHDEAFALNELMLRELRGNARRRAQLKSNMALLHLDQGKYAESKVQWDEIIVLHPGRREEAEARWWAGWCRWKLNQSEEAIQVWDGLLDNGAKRYDLDDRVRFWKARAFESLHRYEEANALYEELTRDAPAGYYQELARRQVKGKEWRGKGSPPTMWQPTIPEAKAFFERSLHLARALVLDQFGMGEEVGRELKAIHRRDDVPRDLVAWLAAKNQVYDIAYVTARYRFAPLLATFPERDGFERFIWEQVYPQAYRSLIEETVGRSELDPLLVMSLMWAESTYRPEVVSPAGAIGLLQLMPSTAAQLAQEQGEENFDSRDLFRPAVNIEFGVRYLKKLKKLFPDNTIAWIASYNAGEQAVERWLASRKKMDPQEFIEEIPYRETNLYVKKVLNAYWVRQRLYK
ncbi:MAG: transglycosylase SLT domain-containing protein [Deltaproteobacteria bacterium]|nr:transglycosylase SLT domain-containing protein [Deltaproteobacteria bacterium]